MVTNFDESAFAEDGLYILQENGQLIVALTEHTINQALTELNHQTGSDPRALSGIAKCANCPAHDEQGCCRAIGPLLVVFNKVADNYKSFDQVVSVYKAKSDPHLSVVKCSMQDALTFPLLEGMFHFCSMTKQFKSYFFNINPQSDINQLCPQIYTNIARDCSDDVSLIASQIGFMSNEIGCVVDNYLRWLRFTCKNDAIINAIANAKGIFSLLENFAAERQRCLKLSA